MKLTTTQMYMLGGVVIVALVMQARKAQAAAAADQKQNDPENWIEDMWARLQGRDLSIDGNHPAPSGYDAYGVTNTLGWAYPVDPAGIKGTEPVGISADANPWFTMQASKPLVLQ